MVPHPWWVRKQERSGKWATSSATDAAGFLIRRVLLGTIRCAYCGEPMELSLQEVRRFPQEKSASKNGDSKQKERLFRKKGNPYPWPFDPRD